MTNHYHLLVETPEPNLVAGMRWFQTTSTVRFNRRHRLAGHLFQGRYRAVVVDPEERGYLVTLSDYIHLNPVRAGEKRKGVGLIISAKPRMESRQEAGGAVGVSFIISLWSWRWAR